MSSVPKKVVVCSFTADEDGEDLRLLGKHLNLRIRSYSAGAFRENMLEYIPTVVENFHHEWKSPTTGTGLDLVLWDTSGGQKYNNLRILSYPATDAFICLFDLCIPANLEKMATLWIPEMLRFANVPVVLVGCFPEQRNIRCLQQMQQGGTRLPFVTPEEGRNKASSLGSNVVYLEYSPTSLYGLENIMNSVGELLLATSQQRVSSSNRTNFPFKLKMPNLFSRKNTTHSAAHPVARSLKRLNANIQTAIEQYCGAFDAALFSHQLTLIDSHVTLGVAWSAFSLLRIVLRITDDDDSSGSITTGNVVYHHIIPSSASEQCPWYYFFLGRRDTSGQALVDTATAFLSHAWGCPYPMLQTIAQDYATMHYCQRGTWPYYWCDVFIKNQHTPAPSDAEFIKAIADCNLTIGALDRGHKPTAINRIWCLFEYHHTISSNAKLVFFLPLSEASNAQLLQDSTVNVHEAHATVPEDKIKILTQIEQSVGTEAMNEQLTGLMVRSYEVMKKEAEYRMRLLEVFQIGADAEL